MNKFNIEFEQETDGRWIADVVELPGVMAYGETREEAGNKAEALALRVLADKLDAGECQNNPASITFQFA